MKKSTTSRDVFVGVDVSKDSLDIYRPDTQELLKIDNSETAVVGLCQQLQKKKRGLMVVMEATGGYETLLVNQLALHNLKTAGGTRGQTLFSVFSFTTRARRPRAFRQDAVAAELTLPLLGPERAGDRF